MSPPHTFIPLLVAALAPALMAQPAFAMNSDPAIPAPQMVSPMPISIESPDAPPDWRIFLDPSPHPNGEHIYFTECRDGMPYACRILRLHLPTNTLAYYQMPAGHIYLQPRLSPSGKKLALVRIPITQTAFPASLERREIVVMNADGSELEVLPLAGGFKARPSFNADESRLAFWRAMPNLQAGAGSIAYDVYEYDFHENRESAFGPRYRFYGGGKIHYLPGGGEVLAEANLPLKEQARFQLDSRRYLNRYPNMIFRLKRGETEWVPPVFAHETFRGARHLHLKPDGTMAFHVAAPTGNSLGHDAIYVYSPQTGFQRWNQEGAWIIFGIGRPTHLAMLNDEVIGIYQRYGSQEGHTPTRFLSLNIKTGILRALPIPALATASPIPVSFKTRQPSEPDTRINPNRPPQPLPAAPPMSRHRFLRTACGKNTASAIRASEVPTPIGARTGDCSTSRTLPTSTPR